MKKNILTSAILTSALSFSSLVTIYAEEAKPLQIQGESKIDPAMIEKLKAEGRDIPAAGQGGLDLKAEAKPMVPKWSEPRAMELDKLQILMASEAVKKESWLKDSYAVAMRTAVYFSAGKMDAPLPGTQQVLSLLNFGNIGGAGQEVTADVQFLGMMGADSVNERFSIKLKSRADGTWAVVAVFYSKLLGDNMKPGI